MMEWDPRLAPLAREIASDVIAESGLEVHRNKIKAGEWDGDDHVIIAMRALMAMRERVAEAMSFPITSHPHA
jgi:hypothetical protein